MNPKGGHGGTAPTDSYIYFESIINISFSDGHVNPRADIGVRPYVLKFKS